MHEDINNADSISNDFVFTKTDSCGNNADGDNKLDVIDAMTQKINEMCEKLIMSKNDFNATDFVEMLTAYMDEYDRILYSPISNCIYHCYITQSFDEAAQMVDNINENIIVVLGFVNSKEYQSKVDAEANEEKKKAMQDVKKSVLKIWDHANLADKQYQSLKQTDDEFRTKFDERFNKEFLDSMTLVKENLTKEMSAQLITMVGIFTALAFLIFGGISSLDNLFTNQDLSIPRLMIIGSVWGLCILNLVFAFLFCVGKMTKLNFKSTEDKGASIFCKYPIVWWCDFAILMVLGASIWLYYLTTRDGLGWLDECCNSSPKLFAIVGSILLVIIFVVLAIVLSKLTRYREPENKDSSVEKTETTKNG